MGIIQNILNNFGDFMERAVYVIPAILIALTVHEFSHGYVSYKLGDPTARNQGRLSLNPLKHLDPVGTIMIFITAMTGFGIGWAKPVPIHPGYYKNWKRGTRLTSLAGPVSNFLMAIIAYAAISICDWGLLYHNVQVLGYVANFFYYFLMINIGLGCFNLIPVPPLDGSKIFGSFLPDHMYHKLLSYENYIGMAFLLIILFRPQILNLVLDPLFNGVLKAVAFINTPLSMLLGLN